MTCPVCSEPVSELIEHPRLDVPMCYYCACVLLGLPRAPDLVETP